MDNLYARAFYRRGMLYKKIREYNLALNDFALAIEHEIRLENICSREIDKIKLVLGNQDGAKKDFDINDIAAKINKFKSRYGGTYS